MQNNSIKKEKNRFLEMVLKDTELEQVSRSGAGEWAGPCPFCGGNDRFHVRLGYAGSDDAWFCRGCSPVNAAKSPMWQTPLQYIMRRDNVGVFAARMIYDNWFGTTDGVTETQQSVKNKKDTIRTNAKREDPQLSLPFPPDGPDQGVWQAQAEKFTQECNELLYSEDGAGIYEYLRDRGLNGATIDKYKLGFSPESRREASDSWGFSDEQGVFIPAGLVIPWYMDGKVVAVNIRRFDEQPKYMIIRGSKRGLFGSDNLHGKTIALLVEGELDCILADQEVGDVAGCMTLGSATGTFDLVEHAPRLLPIRKILVAGDNDDAGHSGVGRIRWIFKNIVELKIPALNLGDKDISDYRLSGGDIRRWFIYNCGRLGVPLPAIAKPAPVTDVVDIAPMVTYIDSAGGAHAAIREIEPYDTISLDIETFSCHDRLFVKGMKKKNDRPATDAFRNEIRVITIGAGERQFVFDLLYIGKEETLGLLNAIKDKYWLGHNLKFDILNIVHKFGRKYLPERVFDTMIAETLIWLAEHEGRVEQAPLSLKSVVKNHLDIDISKSCQLSDWSYGPLSAEQINYAASDVSHLNRVALEQIKKLNAMAGKPHKQTTPDALGLQNKVARIEMDFLPIVVGLELAGMPVNLGVFSYIDSNQEPLISEILSFKEKHGVSITQNQKIAGLLSERLGVDIENTSYGSLCNYLDDEVVAGLVDYRTRSKNIGKLSEFIIHLRDGRIYPNYRQIGAPTGRMAAQKPATQNIPRVFKDELIRPASGRVIIRADYPAIELRLAATIAHEPELIEVFRNNEDAHKKTACFITGKDPDAITKEERQQAKAVNFGFVYGMGAERFMQNAKIEYNLHLTIDQAYKLKEKYLQGYEGIRQWQKQTGSKLTASGVFGDPNDYKNRKYKGYVVETLYGRRMKVARYNDALNYPVQGSGADLLKDACIRFNREINSRGLDASIVALIHDEVVVETAAGNETEVAGVLKACMEKAADDMIECFHTEVDTQIIHATCNDVRTGSPCDTNAVPSVDDGSDEVGQQVVQSGITLAE